ncbi:hypothetical protein [Amycolatopsis sp. NPDC004169]|uniref:hypothetical protein n=1 Tax=Amycolatopsis sp. NPDC004169 TaxID=3154453 RepID=UPI0033A39782
MHKRIGLLAAAVITLLIQTVPGTAYADYPTAYNLRTQWLTNDPTPGDDLSLARRTVVLKDGVYGWWPYVDPPAVAGSTCETYTGHIFEGTYTWEEQLWPGSPTRGSYRLDSYLSDSSAGTLYKITCYFRLNASGNYTWGSGLDPHF